MKSCPTCNRTFEDTFTFCLVDGAILSAPFDPLATQANGSVRDTGGARTEVLPSPSYPGNDPLGPTAASPPLRSSPATLFATQLPPISNAAPAPVPNPSWDPPVQMQPALTAPKPINRGVQFLLGFLAMVVIGFLYSLVLAPRAPIALPLRVLCNASGVILAVLIRRGWIGALLSVVIGLALSNVFLGMMGRHVLVLTTGNLIAFGFFAGYGIIGWAVTRLIGWVMSSLSRKSG
jgi:hypothetical protein